MVDKLRTPRQGEKRGQRPGGTRDLKGKIEVRTYSTKN